MITFLLAMGLVLLVITKIFIYTIAFILSLVLSVVIGGDKHGKKSDKDKGKKPMAH